MTVSSKCDICNKWIGLFTLRESVFIRLRICDTCLYKVLSDDCIKILETRLK